MNGTGNTEIFFLIKAFARYCSELDAINLFKEQFGKEPTRWQLSCTNLGRFLGDKRPYFKLENNYRVKRFKKEREKYHADMQNLPIADLDWRLEQYQKLYARAERRSFETGNTTRCTEIMAMVAKEKAGGWGPKNQTFNVDNRQVINRNLSDEEINKRITKWFNQVGVSVPDMPLVEIGATLIELQSDSDDEE